MIFVKEHVLDSTFLRGDQIADELGTSCMVNSIQGAREGEIVVLVKTAQDAIVEDARRRKCRIAYDPIDYLCYEADGRPIPQWFADVDFVIVPNYKCEAILRPQFQKAEFFMIPHQWDARLHEQCEHDEFRPGYVGRKFNLPAKAEVPMVLDTEQMRHCASWFNCHIALKEQNTKAWTLKPATKVATAAAVGAAIITMGDPSAYELLGPDYPFYLDTPDNLDAALSYCRSRFNTQEWRDALRLMEIAKRRTSIQAIAKQYEAMNES